MTRVVEGRAWCDAIPAGTADVDPLPEVLQFMPYTQALRPLAVETVLGPDVLLLTAISGVEELSRPYAFVLDLVSENRRVDVDALVGTAACVTIASVEGETRCLHGLLRRVRQVGHGTVLASYQAELVPWLWMLSLSADCRIFQQLSVPEIVAQVFADLGYADYELRLVRTYPKREYCVQYRESHLDFVSRLLEDEGISYHFAHAADKHTLVLTDSPAAARACPGLATLAPVRLAGEGSGGVGNAYTTLTVDRTLQTRAVALADYDYLHPSASLAAMIAADVGLGEAFDYPGGFVVADEGDRYARLRLEAADAQREIAEGESGAAAVTSGYKMAFQGDGPGAGGRSWLVTRVAHAARQGGMLGGSEDDAFVYSNHFTLASADLPWRPPRRTPRPRVQGTQSALVVGKSGEEIWTDAHGRVKLHFYWDRHGTRDENSSCWVRCSTAWAGRGYGQFSVPRIGQEVLVDFLEGDPDRPVVVGRVYNADQPPPCDPGGAGGVVSGLRSKTHKGGGYNGIEMNDTTGKEHFAVHAQYDMGTDVGHDDTQTVKHNRTVTITQGNLSEDVVAGTATSHVQGAVTETYDATQATTVKGDITIVSTTGGIAVAADAQHVYIKGTTSIQLHVGSSMLWMDAGGQITIKGVNVSIEGDNVAVKGASNVTVKGGTVHSEADSQHQIKGAIVLSEGSATNTVKGGMVMLNP